MYERSKNNFLIVLFKGISVWDVILALHYEYLHVQLPGSKKLAKIISNHFLDLLNYKALENRVVK